jgi:hypothetical protein
MAAKPRETYDIAETAVKWGAALDRLRAEQRPGVKSGWGGKAAVLQAVRDRLQALAADGYTAGQIADALREVSPRMVRAALRTTAREGAKPNTRRASRRPRLGPAESGDGRRTGSVTESAPADRRPAAARSDAPTADALPAHPGPASVPDGGASVSALDAHAPVAGPLTPALRAQHRIPDWADGTDLRPGETLAQYAVRKRVAGAPRDLSMFIGEGRRDR